MTRVGRRLLSGLGVFALGALGALGGLAALGAADAVAPPNDREELLLQHRNLGKAFYENPTTQREAVGEFRQALELAPGSAIDRLHYALALLKAGRTGEGIAELETVQRQDPTLPHTWFNLGIAYKRDAQYERALAQFERMVALVADEPVSRYNLGTLYKLAGKPAEALLQFEAAARLAPRLAGPHFQLYNAYKQAGRQTEAARELETFQALKKEQEGAAIPEDLEWSYFSEIADDAEARAAALPAAANPQGAAVAPRFAASELLRGVPVEGAGLAVLDADGDGQPDLLLWSAQGVRILRGATTLVEPSGLEGLRDVLFVAPGDFDDDGLPDLCVVSASGASLWHNERGRFARLEARLPAGRFASAVWLDFDHDYDQDLVLLGATSAVMRNDGAGGWSDQTARFPFAAGQAIDAAAIDLVADTQGMDLVVAYADHSGVAYRDRLGGVYQAEPLSSLPAGARGLVAMDFDGDGWTDLLGSGLVLRNHAGQLGPAGAAPAVSEPFALASLDNRGASASVGAAGVRDGGAVTGRFVAPEGWPKSPPVALVAADFDGDGRVDLALLSRDGILRRLLNTTPTPNRWLEVRLAGVKNPKLAVGARVEVKRGSLYAKQLYRGVPLHFGLGTAEQVDTVRITWPNGLVQNETRQATSRVAAFKEAQRLSGSCPMIFVWNGNRFAFVSDVLGVAPLGASAGDGEYFPVDHDEYVQIPGDLLQARDGQYEIRISEELREVSYLDEIRLVALDHPAQTELFTNDKFKSPPFPEFRLFGVERRIPPVMAREADGRDVRERLLRRDAVYPDGFHRDASGVAELHTLDLDFGDVAADGRAILVLNGWVDWADGSTYLAAAQASPDGLVMPKLQVKDGAGAWRTVVDDMGIPAGKPKTIVVDLEGKWLSGSREIRIVTSLCVYWDEIFLAEQSGAPRVRRTDLAPLAAELRFRGFSRPVIHPRRLQPERFEYDDWMPVSMWNPTPGLYTRYGDVKDLLSATDDELAILGSGDEVRLRFDERALPALASGWRRDFLLLVDGWAKDADANTAFSQSVEPLPFHAMSRYPYPDSEHFPDDPAHRQYRLLYNTRPALRLLPELRAPVASKEVSTP